MSNIDYTGQTLDNRYRIISLLGKGGMGAVYLGQHIVVGKKVAVKFLHAEFAGKEFAVKRFYRESRASAAIGHKNIIEVHDAGVSANGEPYLVMEYLEGESLSSMLARTGPLDLAAACGIMEPALLALQAAHDKGVVHRDLKPENIFLVHREGEAPSVKLIDFGISKFPQEANQSNLTKSGALMGTPAYMPSEQARGARDVDYRADIYSMGVVLYEMLTNGLPFVGENYNEQLINILTIEPRPPGEVFTSFPQEAEPLIIKTLAKDPEKRPQSATEFLDALKKLSGFENREERLTHFTSGIKNKTYASGDLGETINMDEDGNLAENVLSQIVKENTPKDWAQTAVASRKNLKYILISSVSLAAAVAIGLVLFFNIRGARNQEAAVVPIESSHSLETQHIESAAQTKDDGIKIEVKGAPEGAEIFYDKAPVPMNPFKVKRADTISTIAVKASGFKDFVTSVIPDRDRMVEVKLEPEKEMVSESELSADNKSSSERSKEYSKKKQVIKKAAKGAEFTEKFE